MIFSERFLEQLIDNPFDNWKEFHDVSNTQLQVIDLFPTRKVNEDSFIAMVEIVAVTKNLLNNPDFMAEFKISALDVEVDFNQGSMIQAYKWLVDIFTKINNHILAKENQTKRLALENRIKLNMSKGIFVYEFSQGDLDKVQNLISELRTEISHSELFEEKHKQRLLKRLEKLQSELHKKMSDLDGFWGLIGDAGVAIGKFGNDVKPIVDRIKEITEVVWQTQSRAEELPSGTPVPVLEDRSNTAL